MFSLNRVNTNYNVKIVQKPVPSLTFRISTSKNNTRSIFCNYFDGTRNYQEYFNFQKNGKLTQGSFLDFKRLCDCFGIIPNTRFEILNMHNEDVMELKNQPVIKVITDFGGFMKWFEGFEK